MTGFERAVLTSRAFAEHVGDQIVQKASADRIRFHATLRFLLHDTTARAFLPAIGSFQKIHR